jgi:four helix bundle protein
VAQHNGFEDLPVWQDARRIAKEIYSLTRETEFARDHGLKNQIQRASVSVVSNIAEGFDYGSNKQFVHFLKIAKGSASEVRAQLVLATDIGYVSKAKQKMLKEELKSLSSQITGFIKYLESQNSK